MKRRKDEEKTGTSWLQYKSSPSAIIDTTTGTQEHKNTIMSHPRPPKPPSPPAIAQALAPILADHENVEELLAASPRRWVVYAPMALLPGNSFASPAWTACLEHMGVEQRSALWRAVLGAIARKEGQYVTHLAVNKGIPLREGGDNNASSSSSSSSEENIMRCPSGLLMLHGDFGPDLRGRADGGMAPSPQDLDEAFWVRVKQHGIVQIWAPRWTMFSRGNVGEKHRVLKMVEEKGEAAGGVTSRNSNLVVDMYAGIGYFVFSYVQAGAEQVLGWELNPWSVEGLRRGAVANGWSVQVVRGHADAKVSNAEAKEPEESITSKIVIFAEDNRHALERLRARNLLHRHRIGHVNCGLLPTSAGSWHAALAMVDDGWLHLHENRSTDEVDGRRVELDQLLLAASSPHKQARVEHVEFVKTFAPGVWHVVFDVRVWSRVST